MRTRISLNEILVRLLESNNVYFQPPASLRMKYPAIRYSRSNKQTNYADDSIYKEMTAYELIVIDVNPDSEIPDRISRLPYCSFDRDYKTDNLNHFVFTLYY